MKLWQSNTNLVAPSKKSLANLKRQAGLSAFGWLFVLAVAAFLANFGFKVVPMYFENRLVIESLKQVEEPGHALTEMSDAEIRKRIINNYDQNRVNSSGPQNIVFDRKGGAPLIVKVDYEARANLIWNIDVVLTFENHLDVLRPAACCRPVDRPRDTNF